MSSDEHPSRAASSALFAGGSNLANSGESPFAQRADGAAWQQ
jgi:hypothetical protein